MPSTPRTSRSIPRLATTLLLLTLSMAPLIACSGSPDPRPVVEVPVVEKRPVPPDLVQPCPRLPARPAAFASEKERFAWMLWALGNLMACQVQSDKQTVWMLSQPT